MAKVLMCRQNTLTADSRAADSEEVLREAARQFREGAMTVLWLRSTRPTWPASADTWPVARSCSNRHSSMASWLAMQAASRELAA
jgi:hypothetical protein